MKKKFISAILCAAMTNEPSGWLWITTGDSSSATTDSTQA